MDCSDEELTANMNKGKFRLAFKYETEYEYDFSTRVLLIITCHTNIVSRARGKQRERAKVQGLASTQSLLQSLPPGRYWGVVLPSSPGRGEYDSLSNRLRGRLLSLHGILSLGRHVTQCSLGGVGGGGGGLGRDVMSQRTSA